MDRSKQAYNYVWKNNFHQRSVVIGQFQEFCLQCHVSYSFFSFFLFFFFFHSVLNLRIPFFVQKLQRLKAKLMGRTSPPCVREVRPQSSILSIGSVSVALLWGIFLSDLGQESLSPVSQWSSLLPVRMPSYCCSSSDFLRSHYTVPLSSSP